MKFKKYESLTNTYRQEFLDKIMFEEKDGDEWVVTEKIHGANFSIWINPTEIRLAKRSAFLPDDSGFFSVYDIIDVLKEKARNLYNYITANQSDEVDMEIAIYGELFGGGYPHKDVPVNPRSKKVQNKVWYSPDTQFAVYDISSDGNYLPFSTVSTYAKQFGFTVVPELFRGSFKECLDHSNEFLSEVYKMFGLPPLEDNICEGIVIRPETDRYVFGEARVILKSKNKRFAEREEKTPKVRKELSAELATILGVLNSYVTENRYDAVVSKIGDVSPRDFGMILGLMVKDVIEEMQTEQNLFSSYSKLDKSDRKTINKHLGFAVSKVVRKKLIGC